MPKSKYLNNLSNTHTILSYWTYIDYLQGGDFFPMNIIPLDIPPDFVTKSINLNVQKVIA